MNFNTWWMQLKNNSGGINNPGICKPDEGKAYEIKFWFNGDILYFKSSESHPGNSAQGSTLVTAQKWFNEIENGKGLDHVSYHYSKWFCVLFNQYYFSPKLQLIDDLYRIVYHITKNTPWIQNCPAWSSVEKSEQLISHLRAPDKANLAEKICILEEVRTGYLECIFRCPFASYPSLGVAICLILMGSTLVELNDSDFYRYTLQAQRKSHQ
jgi:hypothetical protein